MIPWFAALTVRRKIVAGVAALLVIAALIWAVTRVIDGIKESGRAEVRAEWAAERKARATARDEVEEKIEVQLRDQFERLSERVGHIDTRAASINVRLPQAIAEAPRYRDPACALTQPVLDQVNAARALSTGNGQ